MEEGDFRGAVRLTCSEDSIASNSEDTIAALRSKHPPSHPESTPSETPSIAALIVNEVDVMQAIRFFPKGSAGGPDGLRPQHLQDMTGTSAGAEGAFSYCNPSLPSPTLCLQATFLLRYVPSSLELPLQH